MVFEAGDKWDNFTFKLIRGYNLIQLYQLKLQRWLQRIKK